MRTITLLLLCTFLASCERSFDESRSACYLHEPKRNFVSIIQLESVPKCYFNKISIVQGIFVDNGWGQFIYDDLDSVKYDDQSKRIGVFFPDESMKEQAKLAHGKRVQIVGKLTALHQFTLTKDIFIISEKQVGGN